MPEIFNAFTLRPSLESEPRKKIVLSLIEILTDFTRKSYIDYTDLNTILILCGQYIESIDDRERSPIENIAVFKSKYPASIDVSRIQSRCLVYGYIPQKVINDFYRKIPTDDPKQEYKVFLSYTIFKILKDRNGLNKHKTALGIDSTDYKLGGDFKIERKYTYHAPLEVLRKNSEQTPFLIPYLLKECFELKHLHQKFLCSVNAQGLIVNYSGDPITNTTTNNEYVLTIDYELYINITGERLHHSDLSLSGSILAAGHIYVDSGIVRRFSNRSGHYKPSDTRTLFLYCYFIKYKVQVSPEYSFDAFIEKLRRNRDTAIIAEFYQKNIHVLLNLNFYSLLFRAFWSDPHKTFCYGLRTQIFISVQNVPFFLSGNSVFYYNSGNTLDSKHMEFHKYVPNNFLMFRVFSKEKIDFFGVISFSQGKISYISDDEYPEFNGLDFHIPHEEFARRGYRADDFTRVNENKIHALIDFLSQHEVNADELTLSLSNNFSWDIFGFDIPKRGFLGSLTELLKLIAIRNSALPCPAPTSLGGGLSICF